MSYHSTPHYIEQQQQPQHSHSPVAGMSGEPLDLRMERLSFAQQPSFHPSQYSPHPTDLVAIPAPQPKTSYSAPVFQTFQDRKRAKGMTQLPPKHPTPSYPSAATNQPPLSTMALMGTPSDRPPLPPSRSPSLPSTIPQEKPSFDPPRQAGPSRPLPLPQSPAIRNPPSPAFAPAASPSPRQSPIPAALERSDTVSSVKSLDRLGFSSGKRPLPRTPVGVNSSKSLDRGIPARDERWDYRKQPSVVEEEETSTAPSSPQVIATPPAIIVPTVQPPSITLPDMPLISVDSSSTPAISKDPARFAPLPSFNFPGDDDSDDSDSGKASGVAVTDLPIISVSTGHSHDNKAIPEGAIVCAGCGQAIIGRIVNAMNRRFHPQCFNCNECGTPLEHVSSYEWEGKAYCHLDYHDRFAHHCFYCKTAIVEDRFITLNDPTLGERYYHELHFFCSECGDPFLDPSKSSAPGTEHSLQDEVGETNPFVIQKGHPYCERCHLRLHKPKCRACRKPIPDVAVDALGHKWHQECFVCSNCHDPFANNRFFPNEGKPLCIHCWESTL